MVVRLMEMHCHEVHVQGGDQQGVAVAKAEKVPRPTVRMDMGEDDFLYFEDRWRSYKRATGLSDQHLVRDQLLAACTE